MNHDDLIHTHMPLAATVARDMFRKMPTVKRYYVSVEDAVSDAYLALVKAATRFDASKGATFRTYLVACVRGALRACYGHKRQEYGGQVDTLDPQAPGENVPAEAFPEWRARRATFATVQDRVIARYRRGDSLKAIERSRLCCRDLAGRILKAAGIKPRMGRPRGVHLAAA
jgi:RNA polymerase sigma factor (sigma-70 family)